MAVPPFSGVGRKVLDALGFSLSFVVKDTLNCNFNSCDLIINLDLLLEP